MRSILNDSGSRAVLYQDREEDEGPGDQVLSYKHVRSAKKQHACDGCPGGQILPGENYHLWAILDAGDRFRLMRFCRGICRQNGRLEGIGL
jgi:hypothetical protein